MIVFGIIGFLLVYYRRRVANLKAEINHVVSYMSGEPPPGNFDNPVYQFQGNSSGHSGDTSVLINSNGVIRNNLRIPPKPTNLQRYQYGDDGSSVASSRGNFI